MHISGISLLAFLVPAFTVQYVATTVSCGAPNLQFLQTVFGKEAVMELSNDADVARLMSLEWGRWETDPRRLPFLACTTSNRESVQHLLDEVPLHVPLMNDGSCACFVVHATKDKVDLLADLEIATPVPGIFKIAEGFFDQMNSDAFVGAACRKGVHVTTAPGFDPVDVQELADRVRTRLSTGTYRQDLANFFVSTDSVRGQRWQERIATAVSHAKNFTSIEVIADTPYLSIPDLCFPEDSSSIIAIVAYLATLPDIVYVEPSPVVTLLNWNSAGIVQSGTSTIAPLWAAGLTGKGQVVGVSDTGLDVTNCYFRQTAGGGGGTSDTSVFGPASIGAFNIKQRKVVQYVPGNGDSVDVLNGHGTHVCGTIVGYIAGSAIGGTNNYNGVAPEAKVAFFDGATAQDTGLSFPLSSLLYRPQLRAGARVFSQSWGTGSNIYASNDVQIDRYMYQNPQTLTINAAGNSGRLGTSTVGSPSLSKNCISVGATDILTTYPTINLADFSSIGPSGDGRFKPDLVAPGTSIISAAGGTACGTVGKLGTSMSCPLVAGLALLVRQYFMEGWYPTGVKTTANRFVPSGALVKAMLINSAVRVQRYTNNSVVLMLGPPPDMYQGFGQVMMSRVLRLGTGSTQPDLFVVTSRPTATGNVHTYKFTVRSNYVPPTGSNAVRDAFEVTLTWTDPDGLASAAKNVLHDLDLVASLDSVPATPRFPNNLAGPDTLNNVEKIRIEAPSPGDVITISITGTSIVVTPTQTYALVASGPFVAAAWFCQDPRIDRVNLQWRTEYCPLPCTGVFLKNPRCCATLANSVGGTTCDSSNASMCTGITSPQECVV